MHLVMDYYALNKVIVKKHYPLPWIDNLLDHIKGVKFFMTLDLISGYHQVPMNSQDTWKTIFKTKFGLYEWLVMPFGITNAPTTFMKFINDIFRPHLRRFIIIYPDELPPLKKRSLSTPL
jgi:hypothetical protein